METANKHKLLWEDKNNGLITGVEDVISFESDQILLKTNLGTLSITGKDFQVRYFSVEQHEIALSGDPVCLKYSNQMKGKGKNALSRLLK